VTARGPGAARVSDVPKGISHPFACEQCGYGLVGLPHDGSCPECGHSIAASRDTDRRVMATLGTRVLGLTGPLLASGLAMVVLVAMIAAALWVAELAVCLSFLAAFLHVGASCAAGAQCGPTQVEKRIDPWRRAARVSAMVALVALLCVPVVVFATPYAGLPLTSTWIVLFGWWITNGVIVAGSAWTLTDLARSLALTDRDGGARLAFFLAVPSVVLALIGLATTQLQITWQSGEIIGAVAISSGLFAYVVAVLALSFAAFRLRRAVRRREGS